MQYDPAKRLSSLQSPPYLPHFQTPDPHLIYLYQKDERKLPGDLRNRKYVLPLNVVSIAKLPTPTFSSLAVGSKLLTKCSSKYKSGDGLYHILLLHFTIHYIR
jgi:hypothetical protein